MNKVFILVSIIISGDCWAAVDAPACTSFHQVPPEYHWNNTPSHATKAQIIYAKSILANGIETPKSKRFKTIKLSYKARVKGITCLENGRLSTVDSLIPTTETYTQAEGSLISISTGSWHPTGWGNSGSIISFAGIIGLPDPEDLDINKPIKINGELFKPNPGGTFAIGYPKEVRTGNLTETWESFRVCTWGDTLSGVGYGVNGMVTSLDCAGKEKYQESVISKWSDSYLYLHDYAIFVSGPRGLERNNGRYKSVREDLYINVK